MLRRDRAMTAVSVILDVALHAGRTEPCSAADIAGRLCAARRGIEPVLQALTRAGLLEGVRGPAGGYRLGIVMFELGEAVKVHLDLHAAAGPVHAQLREQTGESSQVGVLDGNPVTVRTAWHHRDGEGAAMGTFRRLMSDSEVAR